MKLFCNLLRPFSSRAGPIWRLNPSSGVHARRLYTPQLIRPSYAPVGSSPRLLQRRISSKRFNSSAASTLPSSATPSASSNSGRTTSAPQPSYEITFTCKLCKERSTHGISKQAYHKGSVLITCPLCKNRHVIADHLHIFSDTKTDIEEIMRRKGELVKKGTLGEGGDMEFWDDGSVTERTGPSRE